MGYPLPGIIVDPKGQTVVVTITAPSGLAVTTTTDNAGQTPIANPSTITTRTAFYCASDGEVTVTGTVNGTPILSTSLYLEDATVTTVAVPNITVAGQVSTGFSMGPFIDNGGRAWDVRVFGAKCDGGVSQSGALASTGVVTDTTPPAVVPVAQQLVTWVGLGAAVGGGVAGVTLSASGAPISIATTTAHGLTTGQQATIAGVLGATDVNGVWQVTVVDTTHFTIPLNRSALAGAYTSGGTVTPQAVVFGYVSNPVVTGGHLTFTIVTASGGSTPVTVPAGMASGGTYYFGSDDTASWNRALGLANAVSSPAAPTRVTWSGTSMVSSTILVQGCVNVEGDWMDYVNPDGTNSSSSMPARGSILRAHGNFANPLTAALLQLGNTSVNTSGLNGASTRYGVFDAANICMSALRTVGNRNWSFMTYALNGLARAWDWQGSNSFAIECVGGQSNTGDVLFVGSGDDCKWKGGVLRQGCNIVHCTDASDFWIGAGTHLFNGWGNGNESSGNDILIDSGTAFGGSNYHIGEVICDGVIGPKIRIAPAANGQIENVTINGLMAFGPQTSGFGNGLYPVIQADATLSGTTVTGLTIVGGSANGPGSSAQFKSILDLIGVATTKITLDMFTATYCAAVYTVSDSAASPTHVGGGVSLNNNGTNLWAAHKIFFAGSGNGSTTQFSLAHSCAAAPTYFKTNPASAASIGYWVSADATNVYFNFPTAPANAANLEITGEVSIA